MHLSLRLHFPVTMEEKKLVTHHSEVGIVVIGRNEGERLVRCLESLAGTGAAVIYVDSGSTDDSVNVAARLGAKVLLLDMKTPFTAARARNAGFKYLMDVMPELDYVQFVDGDCEIADSWINKGVEFLDSSPEVAIVSGRCRERYPDRSVYNFLCDMEWDTPVGETKACGGIFMARVKAFQQVDGFREQLIAGEEPELCVRLRARGWKVWRIKAEMVLHDAAITRFGQWWKRNVRGGYAFAEGAWLHGGPPERHWVRESARAWIWGLLLPLLIFAAGLLCGQWGLVPGLLYPLLFLRLGLMNIKAAKPRPWTLAFFGVLVKFPEAIGQLRFHVLRLGGLAGQLIEYK